MSKVCEIAGMNFAVPMCVMSIVCLRIFKRGLYIAYTRFESLWLITSGFMIVVFYFTANIHRKRP